MVEAHVLRVRAGNRRHPSIVEPHQPEHGGMPQIEIAIPELDLGLEQLMGLSQPGLLELSKGPENVREIIVEGKMPGHGHMSGRTRHWQKLKTEFSAMLQKVSYDERQHTQYQRGRELR